LIKFTGCQYVNVNDINDLSPFYNIGDIVSAMFESGQVEANDVSNYDPDIVIEQLQSNNIISILVQDIDKEGHKDYSDFNSFKDRRILKRVTNEAGVVVAHVYGSVDNVHHKVLHPHGNDPVEKAKFMICFDSQANLEIVDVNIMSEYVMNYNQFPQKINIKKCKEMF
jgi:hypothetical protein